MRAGRTCFELYKSPYDPNPLDRMVGVINALKPTRPVDISKDRFDTVDEALGFQYPVNWFGSLNTSKSAPLQANDQILMPSYMVMKDFLEATQEDFDFISSTQHQPKWLSDIVGSVPSPILLGHEKGGNIEHDKTICVNIPVWDGHTEPTDSVQLAILLHQYNFSYQPIADAVAGFVSRGGILLPSVGDGVQGAQAAAIAAYSTILKAWIGKNPSGYPAAWQLYDPVPAASTLPAAA